MIIACPECATRYVVPDNAIGGGGRTVRCAKCKHSWHQDGPELDLTERAPSVAAPETQAPPPAPPPPPPAPPAAEPEPAPEPAPKPAPEPASQAQDAPRPSIEHWGKIGTAEETTAAATVSYGIPEAAKAPVETHTPEPAPEPASAADPLAEQSAHETGADATADIAEAAPEETASENTDADDHSDAPYDDGDYEADYSGEDYDEEGGSQFDYSPPFTRRRNTLKMWTIAAGAFAVLATGTVVAVNYFGLPAWLPIAQPTYGMHQANLELDFPDSQQRKETLQSGEEVYRVRGSIRNIGQSSQSLPSLIVVFRDDRKVNVYSWLVVPSKRELAPGETLNISETVTDIPATAKTADIGWSPN